MNSMPLVRLIITYVVAISLAVFVGAALTSPEDSTNLLVMGLVIGMLVLPFVLKHHHLAVAATWNAALIVFVLPGQPSMWMVFGLTSLGTMAVSFTLNKRLSMQRVPKVLFWAIMLVVVTIGTGMLRGGIGFRFSGGSTYGGKAYATIILTVSAFMALSGRRVAAGQAHRFVAVFFLGWLTAAVCNLIASLPPEAHVLFLLFKQDFAASQLGATASGLGAVRLEGVGWAAIGLWWYLLARFGLAGLFQLRNPGRLLFAIVTVLGTAAGGHRSLLVLAVGSAAVLFFVEGLHRTKAVQVVVFGALLMTGLLMGFADRLPRQLQRALAFLPIRVEKAVEMDALGTSDWRARMWSHLLEQVPEYLILGKGYSIDATEFNLLEMARRNGFIEDYEWAVISGDYHNGPLSVLVPLGLAGAFCYGMLLWHCGLFLRRAVTSGSPQLLTVNRGLFAIYVTRVIFFFTLHGSGPYDLLNFLGLVGLSAAINGVNAPSAATLSPKVTARATRPAIPVGDTLTRA